MELCQQVFSEVGLVLDGHEEDNEETREELADMGPIKYWWTYDRRVDMPL